MSAQVLANLRSSPDVIGHRLGDEFVLIHLRTNKMYELNTTATRIWELLDGGCSREETERRLIEEFDVAESDIGPEIDALLAHLDAEKLTTG